MEITGDYWLKGKDRCLRMIGKNQVGYVKTPNYHILTMKSCNSLSLIQINLSLRWCDWVMISKLNYLCVFTHLQVTLWNISFDNDANEWSGRNRLIGTRRRQNRSSSGRCPSAEDLLKLEGINSIRNAYYYSITGCRFAERVHAKWNATIAAQTIGGAPDTYGQRIITSCSIPHCPNVQVVLIQWLQQQQ